MEIRQIFAIILCFLIIVAFVKMYLWMRDGGLYYSRYPGAKLLDDVAKQGKLTAEKTDEIVARIANADDMSAEAAKLRNEFGIQ